MSVDGTGATNTRLASGLIEAWYPRGGKPDDVISSSARRAWSWVAFSAKRNVRVLYGTGKPPELVRTALASSPGSVWPPGGGSLRIWNSNSQQPGATAGTLPRRQRDKNNRMTMTAVKRAGRRATDELVDEERCRCGGATFAALRSAGKARFQKRRGLFCAGFRDDGYSPPERTSWGFCGSMIQVTCVSQKERKTMVRNFTIVLAFLSLATLGAGYASGDTFVDIERCRR